MAVSDYSTVRDTNAGIVPGNIRIAADNLQAQQIVNAIRQLMADLAVASPAWGGGGGPFLEPSDIGVTVQAWDAGLDSLAAVTPGTAGLAILAHATATDVKTYLDMDITAGTGLTGGGDLSADLTIALSAGSITSLALADTAVQPLTRQQTRSVIIRGNDVADALWNSLIASYDLGERGPLFIWNNPDPADLETTGENSGMQIWIGDNPTATPGTPHIVGSTIAVINGNNRDALYGQNILVGISTGTGFVDGFLCGMEINTYADFTMTVSDPYGGGSRKNALELTAQGSTGRITTGIMMYATDTTGSAWYQNGIAISRCYDQGITFHKDPGGGSDSVDAFQTAAIYDKSNSRNVLKVDADHLNIINLAGLGTLSEDFVRGDSSASTILPFRNRADFDMTLTIDSGDTAVKQSVLAFRDDGVGRWGLIKNAGNDFALYNYFLSLSAIFVGINDNSVTLGANLFLSPAASVTPTVNGQVTFQLTSNTQLTFKAKGSDGTVRSGSVTLA